MPPHDKAVKIAASPINWHNDDFPILGADTAVDTILREIKRAGFDGTELGSVFPSDPRQLTDILRRHDLELAAGWFSTFLLSRNVEWEYERFRRYCDFLAKAGGKHINTAECTRCPFKKVDDDPYTQHFSAVAKPLFPRSVPRPTDKEWDTIARGMIEFDRIAHEYGLTLGYHPHIQTAVENTADLDELARRVERLSEDRAALPITLDTGHLALAGDDPLDPLTRYIKQIKHLHVKNIRPSAVKKVHAEKTGFQFGIIEGIFTVPGDGGLDFEPIFKILRENDYQGWLVVEAEQNPDTANPYLHAKLAREYIKAVAGW